MSHSSASQGPIRRFLFENSIFLIVGALSAFIWANVDEASYQHFVHLDLTQLLATDQQPAEHDADPPHEAHADPHHDDDGQSKSSPANHPNESSAATSHSGDADSTGSMAGHGDSESEGGHHGQHGLSLHFLVNDILMAFFFAIAGKEVWESVLPGGPLSNPRRAMTPLLATLGGIVGPAGLYILGAFLLQETDLYRGWAIPCATDIAFSYLVARFVFGPGHPAIAFLLLLAIADDAAGLVILAVFFPQKPIEPMWLLLTVAAVALGYSFRWLKLTNFWWYLLIPGVMAWLSFYYAGIHAALGLVPIIPCMPHAHTDLGIFARDELNRHDTLNEFEHWWKNPVELILGLFGLVNAGVAFGAVGAGTALVLAGLLIGKPLGITLATWFSEKVLRLEVPQGMSYRHIISLGCIAGIGFTVALFVSEAAYPSSDASIPAAVRDSVKMGALASFLAAGLSFIVARALGVKPDKPSASSV